MREPHQVSLEQYQKDPVSVFPARFRPATATYGPRPPQQTELGQSQPLRIIWGGAKSMHCCLSALMSPLPLCWVRTRCGTCPCAVPAAHHGFAQPSKSSRASLHSLDVLEHKPEPFGGAQTPPHLYLLLCGSDPQAHSSCRSRVVSAPRTGQVRGRREPWDTANQQ